MNEFDRLRLDAIAAGQRPPKTPAEERVREQEEAGTVLRRCMNNAKEEALSLRTQLDAARTEIDRLQADLGDLQEKYAQSESNRLDAEAKLERLHQLIERQHPLPERKEIERLKNERSAEAWDVVQESLDCLYPEDLVTVHSVLSVGPQSYSVRFELYNMADGDREFTGIVNIDSDDLCTWTDIENH